jgi:RNA polymerase sigma-70 factor (ECF subfamily)
MSFLPEQLEDGRLVEQTLRGDRAAFGELYDRHRRRVRVVVSCAVGDASTVDDLIQECYLRAYRKLDQLQPREKFGPWLVGIARLVACEERRSLFRDRHQFVGADPIDFQEPIIETKSGTSSDDLESVMQRIQELPEEERLAIELFFLEECDAERTAELLEMSRSGMYALLKRACRSVPKRGEVNRS